MNTKRQVMFLSITRIGFSRSSVYAAELERIGCPVSYHNFEHKNRILTFWAFQKKLTGDEILIISASSQILAALFLPFIRNFIVADIGWPLIDGEIGDRRRKLQFLRSLKLYLIEWNCAKKSNLVLLESKKQLSHYAKLFPYNKKKLRVLYSGFNELQLGETRFPRDLSQKNAIFTVMFRGKYNAEAGIEVLAKATKILEAYPIDFLIFSPQCPDSIVFSKRSRVFSDFQDFQTIVEGYKKADLCLGQLSDNERLSRTIPHKAFESAYFAKPYLTARQDGILEVFDEGQEILCFEPNSSEDLSKKIIEVIGDESLKSIGKRMHKRYDTFYSQNKLTQNLLEILIESSKSAK